ncbi:hypothetical protein PybrP1_012328 [[Pythium] brassicae (nom. inval.)]|nr:hypothetical protein PybrP1_012328 [[Pythium] brassicae (nom. inval.)]
MEVLRVDFRGANSALKEASETEGTEPASVWTRLLRSIAVPMPLTNRLLPKMKAGKLQLEVGAPPEWRQFDVVLAGASSADLGLYYYTRRGDASPLGCIRLHSAHVDVLEEVVMVVTCDKTWFLCAEHGRDASDWAEAICSAIEVTCVQGVLLHGAAPKRRRLSSAVSAVTLKEIQSREPRTRVDEFLEVFVRSNSEEVRSQAMKGALSWSCMRNLVWKLWLDYLPADVPFAAWLATARDKRQRYASLRKSHAIFARALGEYESDVDFMTACEASDDSLVYDIFKDVRRTRGAMPFFRELSTQSMLVRVLYTYSRAHPEVSYNQGMGELLATLLYLLHIEQWSAASSSSETLARERAETAGSSLSTSSSFEKISSDSSDSDDASYVYVESCVDDQSDGVCLDSAAFLKLAPFAGRASDSYSEYVAAARIVEEMTSSDFLEHDAFVLLEEVMVRMAGAYCPELPARPAPAATLSSSSFVLGSERASSPLYDQMNRIHTHILGRCDPPLARHLSALGVEPQMFALRWVRVLMSREFAMAHVWHVWDAIFALTPCDFSFVNLLCVAAVREFRAEILAAEDTTGALLCFRDISDRLDADRLVDNARELYEALMIAAAVEASSRHVEWE